MITLDRILEIHDMVVKYENALSGVRDSNTLHSIVATQHQGWYDGIDTTLWIVYSICAGHVFNDGNKRTSFLVLKGLEDEGYRLDSKKLSDLILELATETMSKDEFFNKAHQYII